MSEDQEETFEEQEEVVSLEKTDVERTSSASTEVFIRGLLLEILQETHNKAEYTKALSSQIHRKFPSFATDILESILQSAELNIALKDKYDLKCQSHNQYPLFNLMDFIHNFNIDDQLYEKLSFRECLIINKLEVVVDNRGNYDYVANPVGGLCLDVQKAEGKQPQERLLEEYEEKLLQLLDEEGLCDHMSGSGKFKKPLPKTSEDSLSQQNEYGYSKFVVHVSSQLDVDGSNGGSTITSWIDRNLHTIEEWRKEFIVQDDTDTNINEKSLYTAMKQNYYYVKHTSSLDSIDDRKLYSMRKMCDYVSESANFVLMRYLAMKRYFGCLEMSCCYINGDLCRNIYECFGPESGIYNETKVDCCRIKRTIIEECGLQHTSITILSFTGLILKHEWDQCDYVLTVNPKLKLTDAKPTCLDDITSEDTWAEDIQLLSNYLDIKTRSMLEAKTYEADHPELRILMADYVNQILLIRPSDIKNFTFNYFGSFVSTRLPRNDYLE